MKFKKSKCLLICGAVILSMACAATGCNKGGDDSDKSGGTAADFGGKTVTVACWVDMTPKLGGSDYDDARYYAYEYAKEKYNCDIEYISMPEDDYFSTFVAKSLSAQKFADIVTAHCWNYVSWVNQDLLVPVTDWMKDADEHWLTMMPSYKNEIWSVNARLRTTWPGFYMLYNTDVLAELNLESPQELAKKGQWTWDKYRAYCKAAKTDKRYGTSAFWIPEILRMSSDFTTVTYQDGKYYNAWTHAKTKAQGLSVLQMMYDMKVTDGSILGNTIGGSTSSEESIESFRTGNIFICMADDTRARTFKSEGMKNFKPVTLPLGPGVTELKDYIQSFSFFAIPKYKDFETADLVNFWKDCQITWDEDRGDAYDSSTVDDDIQVKWSDCYISLDDTRFMYDMGKNMEKVCTMESAIELNGDDVWKLYQPVLRNTSTPAAAIEATDNIFQTAIDKSLNTSN